MKHWNAVFEFFAVEEVQAGNGDEGKDFWEGGGTSVEIRQIQDTEAGTGYTVEDGAGDRGECGVPDGNEYGAG